MKKLVQNSDDSALVNAYRRQQFRRSFRTPVKASDLKVGSFVVCLTDPLEISLRPMTDFIERVVREVVEIEAGTVKYQEYRTVSSDGKTQSWLTDRCLRSRSLESLTATIERFATDSEIASIEDSV